MRFSMPGMPIRIIPISPLSKTERTCSRLFICSRSASSTTIEGGRVGDLLLASLVTSRRSARIITRTRIDF
jgi:hypothetical protein